MSRIGTSGSSPNRFHTLDSWRGIFAVVVAVGHCFVEFGEPDAVPGSFVLAVDFFFALSGFVIGSSLLKSNHPQDWARRFLISRIFRIFPLYLLVLALYGFIFLPALRGINLLSNSAQEAIGFALLLQDTGLVVTRAWELGRTSIGVAWTLSVEVWCGLAFFSICALLANNRLALVLFLSLSLAVTLGLMVNLSPRSFNVHYHPFGFTTWGMIRGVVGFSSGFLGFIAWQQVHRLKASTLLEIGIVASLIACFASVNYARQNDYLIPVFSGALLLVFAFEKGAISRILLSRPALALGRWSFGIYLWHPLFIEIVRAANLPIGRGNYIIVLAATIVCSAVTFRLVEDPMVNKARSLLSQGGATKAT